MDNDIPSKIKMRLDYFDWRTRGAREMILRLREHGLFDEPPPKGLGRGKDEKIYNKAIIDLLLESKTNAERFIDRTYDEIRFKDHKRGKKGNLISVTAYFAKRTIGYTEIT